MAWGHELVGGESEFNLQAVSKPLASCSLAMADFLSAQEYPTPRDTRSRVRGGGQLWRTGRSEKPLASTEPCLVRWGELGFP